MRPLTILLLALWSGAVGSQEKGNPAMPCYQGLASEARFAPIKDRVSLAGVMEEMRRMTRSAERASTEEKPVLAAWREAREGCHKLEKPYYASRDNNIQAAALQHFAAVQALIRELQAGALTYGEFGRRRIELYEKLSRDIEEIRRRVIPPKPIAPVK